MRSDFKTVEQYIATLTPEGKEALTKLREIVLSAAPGAEEYISYQMPALRLNGPLVYYAAFKGHISLFPGNSKLVEEQFMSELGNYMTSKGTIKFPIDQPLPTALIKRIVKARIKDNAEKAAKKAKGR